MSGPVYRSQYSVSLRAERSGIEPPMGATDFLFSKPALADPGTHLLSSTTSTVDPRGSSGRRVALTAYSNIARRLKIGGALPVTK